MLIGSISFNKGSWPWLKNWRMAWSFATPHPSSLPQNQQRRDHHCLCKSWRWRSRYMGCQMCWTKTTVSLTCSLLFCIPCTPSAPGCQNGKAREQWQWHQRWQHEAAVLEERAMELARAGMANNAARRCRAMPVLKSALAKQCDNGGEITKVDLCRTLMCNISSNIVEHYEQKYTKYFCEN